MQTVACFGDSLIYGFPFGPRISWLAEAEKLTGDKFLNYGVCGDCTDDILSRLKTMPLPAHIKHILFLGGANDIIQMHPQKFILEDLDKTLRYCQSKNFDLGIVLPLVTAESIGYHMVLIFELVEAPMVSSRNLRKKKPVLFIRISFDSIGPLIEVIRRLLSS